MDVEQLNAMRQTARRFARREVAALVGTEGRDGDLASLPGLLERAADAGLLATSDPEGAGFEYGVWGRACPREGYGASLAVLEELAVECAGVAACVHFAGLAALELAEAPEARAPAAVALFDQGWRPSWPALDTPPAGAAVVSEDRLSGASSFVYSAPGAEAFVVYAAGARGWVRVRVPRGAEALTVAGVGQRTGLAAATVEHLAYSGVDVGGERGLPSVTPHAYLRRLMLGLAAIAVGNARGAIRAARQYAEERYQGGDVIGRHAAVQGLIGESHSRLLAAEHCLDGAGRVEGNGAVALWHALAAKLRITLECDQAVTDSLQVLGGYGYMEDYRLEKRLRDAMTLKAMGLAPSTLRLLCAADPGGDR